MAQRPRGALLLPFLALTIAASPADSPPPARNLGPGVAYVGDAACAGCHMTESRTYPLTAMGRSLSLPSSLLSDPNALFAHGASFVNALSNRRYEVSAKGGILSQTEIHRDEHGDDVAADTRIISHILGSGDRGQTFLTRQGSRLYQTAVAYRRHRDGWGMAAGFETLASYDMARPVTAPCLFCHANKALDVDGTLNEYEDGVFEGLAIGCERCHGPGALHVAERRALPATPDGVDRSILNPRRLPRERRVEVCHQCHFQGASRVVKAGKQPHDYRPGLPLSDVFAIFEARGAAGDIKVVSHVERLRESRCWQASAGAVECFTCHDPHRTPKGRDAARIFRDACMTCHETMTCSLDAASRARGGDGEDCVRCHMPKVPPSDAPHTLFTDHRIARVPAPPGERHGGSQGPVQLVNVLEGAAGSPRDLALAYMLYGGAEGDPGAIAHGARLLAPIARENPEDLAALRMMASWHDARGNDDEAIRSLRALVERAPRAAEFKVALGRRLRSDGRHDEALALLESAVAEDPDYAPARLTLGDLLLAGGRVQDAEAQHREALRLDPVMGAAHARIGDHLSRRGDTQGAKEAWTKALALDPSLVGPRLGLRKLGNDDAGE